jgi:7,8-dihydropterin-6-yl-methyl-4-(beta-D-ribofuranosyl)aminobenzene 5'-phosphate synthase
MKITVLIENSVCRINPNGVKGEHGISLFIEMNDKKVLFDTGKSGLFYQNAQKSGIDISEVDYLFISHGHFDHGGGLKKFLSVNQKAKIYLHRKALGKYYAKLLGIIPLYIGLNQKLWQQHQSRFVLLEKDTKITNDLMVIENFKHRFPIPKGNGSLYEKTDKKLQKDRFLHEIALILSENDKNVVLTGCSHSGIVNMYHKAQSVLNGQKINAVLGGFHIHNPVTKKNESKSYLDRLSDALRETGATYYTGHCTGEKNYRYLKQYLGDALNTMRTGEIIEI